MTVDFLQGLDCAEQQRADDSQINRENRQLGGDAELERRARGPQHDAPPTTGDGESDQGRLVSSRWKETPGLAGRPGIGTTNYFSGCLHDPQRIVPLRQQLCLARLGLFEVGFLDVAEATDVFGDGSDLRGQADVATIE